MTQKPPLVAALALALTLLLSACGESEGDGGSQVEDTPATEDAAAQDTPADDGATPTDDAVAQGSVIVAVADSGLGEILVDGEGNTLYLFDNDEGGESVCYDDCASNWPALTAEGGAEAGEGVDAELLGTTERTDGTTQVTYNGHPLYYFAGDQAAGDTNGQGVGEIWWVVSPQGEAIAAAPAAQTGVEY